MSTKKAVITTLYIGFSLGFMVGVVMTSVITTLVISDGNIHFVTPGFMKFIGNPLAAFIIHSLVCGILGTIMLGSAYIYEIDRWTLLKATIIHFIVIVISFYLTVFFLRWFAPTNIKAIITSLIIFIVTYTIIWLIMYLSYKSQIKEINQNLKIKKRDFNISKK